MMVAPAPAPPLVSRAAWQQRFQAVRHQTEAICAPLVTEDYVVQSMVDVSPPKWHLGHSTWFFETFLLQGFVPDYRVYHERYAFLFNSYYNSLGTRVQRDARGHLSRPTVQEVYAFRQAITARVAELVETLPEARWGEFVTLLELGLNHEQQHQELLVTDIKHILAQNPLLPTYREAAIPNRTAVAQTWVAVPGAMVRLGHSGEGFHFDNEGPAHEVLVHGFDLQRRPVTSGEFLQFVEAGGYRDAQWWLSDAWPVVQAGGWEAPLYWLRREGAWHEYTLHGLRPLDLDAPVTHLSYYEAEAYATWVGHRLPTEAEWEHACAWSGATPAAGTWLESGILHPQTPIASAADEGPLLGLLGDTWEWTASAYTAYPGYRRTVNALGEYNGKFMVNQLVLRGGSVATPQSHIRATYRNFFHPDKRWQFTGLRLVK